MLVVQDSKDNIHPSLPPSIQPSIFPPTVSLESLGDKIKALGRSFHPGTLSHSKNTPFEDSEKQLEKKICCVLVNHVSKKTVVLDTDAFEASQHFHPRSPDSQHQSQFTPIHPIWTLYASFSYKKKKEF